MQITPTDVLELLTTEQAATRTGLSVNTLVKHRKQNRGMPFVKLGRTVRYRTADVEAYLVSRTVRPGREPQTCSRVSTAVGVSVQQVRSLPPHLRRERGFR